MCFSINHVTKTPTSMFTTSFRPVCVWTYMAVSHLNIKIWQFSVSVSACLSLLFLNLILFFLPVYNCQLLTHQGVLEIGKFPQQYRAFDAISQSLHLCCEKSFNLRNLCLFSALLHSPGTNDCILYGESNILVLPQLSFSRYLNFARTHFQMCKCISIIKTYSNVSTLYVSKICHRVIFII